MKKSVFKKAAVPVAAAVLAACGIGWWWHLRSAPRLEPIRGGNTSPLYEPQDRPMTVFIKAVEMSNGRLFNMKSVIRQSKSRVNQMKQAVLAYLQGPRTGKDQVPVPPGISLGEFYFMPNGTAVVDLSTSPMDPSQVGFYEEALFIRGLIDTLAGNFYEVKQVKVLVNGQDEPTLAGHYALGTTDATAPVTANGPVD